MEEIIKEYGKSILTIVIIVSLFGIIFNIQIGDSTGFINYLGNKTMESLNEPATTHAISIKMEEHFEEPLSVELVKHPTVNEVISISDMFNMQGVHSYSIASIIDKNETDVIGSCAIIDSNTGNICFTKKGDYTIKLFVNGNKNSYYSFMTYIL